MDGMPGVMKFNRGVGYVKYLPCIIGIWLIAVVVIIIFFKSALRNEEDENGR